MNQPTDITDELHRYRLEQAAAGMLDRWSHAIDVCAGACQIYDAIAPAYRSDAATTLLDRMFRRRNRQRAAYYRLRNARDAARAKHAQRACSMTGHPAWCHLRSCAATFGGPHLSEATRVNSSGGFVQLRLYPVQPEPVVAIVVPTEVSLDAAAGINATLTSLLMRARP